jgi:hypothetical protein
MVNSYSCLFLFCAWKNHMIIRAHYDLTALQKTETSKNYIRNFEKKSTLFSTWLRYEATQTISQSSIKGL